MLPVTLYFKHNFRWWNLNKKRFMCKFKLCYMDKSNFNCSHLKFVSDIKTNNLVNEFEQFYSSIHGDYIAITIPKDSVHTEKLFEFFKEDI